MKSTLRLAGLAGASLLLTAVSAWAGPKTVSGPGANPECFKPWSAQTKFFQWDKKPGPYKIALVTGFVGNTWRIQMVKTAKAFASQPGIKANIKEFKVVSTGTDVAGPSAREPDWMPIVAKAENCAREKLASRPSRIFAVTWFDFPSHLFPFGLCASRLACNLV